MGSPDSALYAGKTNAAICRQANLLAFSAQIHDMKPGRLVVDEPLANRVRSGRKQPQRARHGSSCQPPTPNLFENRPGELQIAAFCAPVLTYLCTLRFGARSQRFSPRRNDFQIRFVASAPKQRTPRRAAECVFLRSGAHVLMYAPLRCSKITIFAAPERFSIQVCCTPCLLWRQSQGIDLDIPSGRQ